MNTLNYQGFQGNTFIDDMLKSYGNGCANNPSCKNPTVTPASKRFDSLPSLSELPLIPQSEKEENNLDNIFMNQVVLSQYYQTNPVPVLTGALEDHIPEQPRIETPVSRSRSRSPAPVRVSRITRPMGGPLNRKPVGPTPVSQVGGMRKNRPKRQHMKKKETFGESSSNWEWEWNWAVILGILLLGLGVIGIFVIIGIIEKAKEKQLASSP